MTSVLQANQKRKKNPKSDDTLDSQKENDKVSGQNKMQDSVAEVGVITGGVFIQQLHSY